MRNRAFFVGAAAGLLISLSALSQEIPPNRVHLGGGVVFPSNGSGWITDHLETGWSGVAGFERFISKSWALGGGFEYLTLPVDTGGTPASDLDVQTDSWGLKLDARLETLYQKSLHLYADVGVGYYASDLLVDGDREDSSSGWGLPLGVGADYRFKPGLTTGLRLGYTPLFLGEGASFDALEIQLRVGYAWGKPLTPSPAARPRRENRDDRDPFDR